MWRVEFSSWKRGESKKHLEGSIRSFLVSGSEYLSLCYAVNSMANVHALDSFIISRTTETTNIHNTEKSSKWSAEHFSWSILDLLQHTHDSHSFLRLLQSPFSTPLHMELISCDITFIKRERTKCVAITPQPCPYLPPTFTIHGRKVYYLEKKKFAI